MNVLEVPAEFSEKVKERRANITHEEVAQLRAIFVNFHAEYWSDADRKKHLDVIVEALDNKLSKKQIQYQYSKYICEYTGRSSMGITFLTITRKFMEEDNKFISKNILAILASMFRKFNIVKGMELLPHLFFQFLQRCYNAFFISPDSVDNIYDILSEKDCEQISFFVHFIKLKIIPFYCQAWQKFANIAESKSTTITGADTILSEIEFELSFERMHLLQNYPDILDFLVNETYVKELIHDVDCAELYYFPNNSNINIYPLYVKLAVGLNKKQYLYNLILESIEIATWELYVSNLTIEGVTVLNKINLTHEGVIVASNSQINEPIDSSGLYSHGNWISFNSETPNYCLLGNELREIVYYIGGSSMFTAIECVPSDVDNRHVILQSLRDVLCVSEDKSKMDKMPCKLVCMKQNYRLTYISYSVLEILFNIEYFVFSPYMNNLVMIAAIGNNFIDYLISLIVSGGYMEKLHCIVCSSLDNVVNCSTDNKCSSEVLSEMICSTFFRHYINTNLKDFVINLKKLTESDKNVLRNVSFRLSVLMRSLKLVDSSDDVVEFVENNDKLL